MSSFFTESLCCVGENVKRTKWLKKLSTIGLRECLKTTFLDWNNSILLKYEHVKVEIIFTLKRKSKAIFFTLQFYTHRIEKKIIIVFFRIHNWTDSWMCITNDEWTRNIVLVQFWSETHIQAIVWNWKKMIKFTKSSSAGKISLNTNIWSRHK